MKLEVSERLIELPAVAIGDALARTSPRAQRLAAASGAVLRTQGGSSGHARH
jgi:hypothetical protein